ncbi:MAG: FAD-binding protein, partial [Chromatiales bacterium]
MKRALLEELREILPPDGLIDQAEALRPYECDGLTALRTLPLAVTLPDTEEQVRRILQCCKRHGAPVVARGAGTGLSGGAQPLKDGIV